MKSYLSLIPISAKVHRRQNRMTLLCIVFAVFMVTAVFSMAEMGFRMEQARLVGKHGSFSIGDLLGSSMGQTLLSVAVVLFLLILIAGVLMISSSMNSSVAQRTQFFGMMRCIGMSKQQTIRFVRLEACLNLKPNTKTAFVGESGSGKSTLAKLLVHYYDVNSGSISIGGQNICDMSLETLNNLVSYVSQDNFLFNTTLMENIRIGKPNATDEEVIEAAKKAQCMEFIKKFPEGFKTLAGDCGNQLSGGEKQRITLARAILKNAPIIILDEATAFADTENEAKIEAAISEFVHNKTLIVIAHRLSSIINADQICVLKAGEIIGCGVHEELLENNECYRTLWEAHQKSQGWQLGKGGIL